MDLPTLQVTWYLLLGVLLAGYAILDGFDLGVGVLHLFAKNEQERRISLNAIGPVWDGNEVWLLTGGGAMFAAFPPVYATVFSGFYLALTLLLLGLILRAVSLEFRGKVESRAWKRVWDTTFGIGSLIPALLFGVALGNIMQGVAVDAAGEYVGGFLGLLNTYALLIGVMGLVWMIMHGAIWMTIKAAHNDEMSERMRRTAYIAWLVFFVLFFVASLYSMLEMTHLFTGKWTSPWLWLSLAVTVAALLYIPAALRKASGWPAFAASGFSMVGLFGLLGTSLFPRLVPSTLDPAFSLTLYNASASQLTLTAMLVIALVGMPLVLGYTIFIYRRFAGPVKLDDASY